MNYFACKIERARVVSEVWNIFTQKTARNFPRMSWFGKKLLPKLVVIKKRAVGSQLTNKMFLLHFGKMKSFVKSHFFMNPDEQKQLKRKNIALQKKTKKH